VGDRHAAARRVGGKVDVGRELIEEGLVERRRPAFGEGDAVEEADDAIRDRAEVVFDGGAEGNRAQRLSPAFVGAGVVALQQQAAVAGDEDRVQVREIALREGGIEALRQVGGEAGGGRGGSLLLRRGRRSGGD
jgi:hypothetical protein